MPKRTPPADTGACLLHCAPTAELIAEIKRRALGCMVVCVRAEEHGDTWHYALKGSPILLGAMTAALTLKTNQQLEG
jgi:hypothetical protein